MKTKLLLTAAALSLGLTSAAQAADTNTLEVSATVMAACGFQLPAATHNLAFGNLDPTSTADATATVTINYWCTNGTTATVTPDNGLYNSAGYRMKNAGTDYVPYALAFTGLTGTGGGKSVMLPLKVDGTIANADYVSAPVGGYADTVVLSLTP
jgi:spore coat protein U-like protein